MRSIATLVSTILIGAAGTWPLTAQDGWALFEDVPFEEEWYEEYKMYILTPRFSAEFRDLEGTEIELRGYVMPTDVEMNAESIILSRYPFSSCFFCGQAGPETVCEVRIPIKRRFSDDKPHTFRGRLMLNDSDLDHLNFILEEAVLLR